MSFATQLINDLSVFFNTGEFSTATITYSGTSINAIVDYSESLDDSMYGAKSKVRYANIEIKVSDVANPTYRDIVIIDSVSWYVKKTLKGDGINWIVQLYRDERPQVAA